MSQKPPHQERTPEEVELDEWVKELKKLDDVLSL